MRAKIFSFVRVSDSSMVASVRIARHVSEQLGIPICDDGTIADETLDVLIIASGAFGFCRHLEQLGTAIFEARRVVWIQNDYTVIIPKEESGAESPFRKAFRDRRAAGRPRADMWTTVISESTATPLSHYVNWNALALDDADEATIARRRADARSDLLYYGSYRVGRRDAFDRYFRSPVVTTVISSPSKKFQDVYGGSSLILYRGKIETSLHDAIGSHGLGLYLEDRKSHSEQHSTPNRLYEMLSAGLPMVFQPECGTSLRRGGYDPSPYVVSSARDVQTKMEIREYIGSQQRAAWLPRAREEREETTRRLHAAWAKLGDQLS